MPLPRNQTSPPLQTAGISLAVAGGRVCLTGEVTGRRYLLRETVPLVCHTMRSSIGDRREFVLRHHPPVVASAGVDCLGGGVCCALVGGPEDSARDRRHPGSISASLRGPVGDAEPLALFSHGGEDSGTSHFSTRARLPRPDSRWALSADRCSREPRDSRNGVSAGDGAGQPDADDPVVAWGVAAETHADGVRIVVDLSIERAARGRGFQPVVSKVDDRLEASPTEDSLPFETPQVYPPGQRSLGRRAIRPRGFELDR